MKRVPVFLRERAHDDLRSAATAYLEKAGAETAGRFVREVQRTLETVALAPEAGSTRAAMVLQIPGLRSWSLASFPWTIFYVQVDDRVEVWRILHQRVDLPSWYVEP